MVFVISEVLKKSNGSESRKFSLYAKALKRTCLALKSTCLDEMVEHEGGYVYLPG